MKLSTDVANLGGPVPGRRRAALRLSGVMLLAVLIWVAASCTGAGNSGGEGERRTVLRVGTTLYIDGFNPFAAQTVVTGTALQMVYPQLAQFSYTEKGGFEVVPDLAKSWRVSAEGKRWTYHLREGAKWSDGKPLTAADAAWTINTVIEFQEGPTGEVASLVEGVRGAEAVDPTTLVVRYEKPVGVALEQLSQLSILPRHVWEPRAENGGRALRTFQPVAADRLVAGGPYTVTQYEKKGTTVFAANPNFYGPASHAGAVALTFYTNTSAMVEALKSGELDWAERVPSSAVEAIEADETKEIVTGPSGLQPTINFNANPRKPENRELLDPRVKEALMMCVDRKQIRNVIFNGYAEPARTIVSSLAGEFENPNIEPPRHDCDGANRRLDELGYDRGPDGIRTVPATTGTHAQPEHPMEYELVHPSVDFFSYDIGQMFQIVARGWAKLGVKVTEKDIGDSTSANVHTYGAKCNAKTSTGYTGWDFELSYAVAEATAVDTLGGETKDLWCAWNFSGYDNPEYDKLHERAVTTIDPDERRRLVWEMQEMHAGDYATTPLLDVLDINAYSEEWTGFLSPALSQYSKRYFTSPRPAK